MIVQDQEPAAIQNIKALLVCEYDFPEFNFAKP